MKIGIDHMAFVTQDTYLAAEELAQARGIAPSKLLTGIGIREIAIARPGDDVVSLAANAGAKALAESGVSPADIGLLIVGTESAEDKSKPTATHVHELLGIGPRCRVYDIVHACAGATYGVLSAIDWLHNPSHRYALVVASDIARYGRGSLGEPTQGAGAVAMVIARDPRLVALTEIGTFSRNVWDFWKPLDKKYPIVDGLYSTQCYNEAASHCFEGVEGDLGAAFLYHIPYPKLVQQAHARVVSGLNKGADWRPHYETHVAPSVVFPARVGNIYTGSLWLALMSLLENSSPQGHSGAYLFSYGSGCGSVLMRGEFGPGTVERASLFGLESLLNARQRITMTEYERLADLYESAAPPPPGPDELGRGPFAFTGIRDDQRSYTKVA